MECFWKIGLITKKNYFVFSEFRCKRLEGRNMGFYSPNLVQVKLCWIA